MADLFIPKKIKVGFQNRKDTYTGKLAYVIYYDEKGNLRKETSWKGWCDSSIPSVEFDNTPRNNYVFNKGIRRYSDWGSGRSVIRVYDPRDFEFEISVDNLIGILMHSDVSKRDIVEECVFAWAGKELVLLPVNSEEYQQSITYTEKQDKKVSAKELTKGFVYSQKKNDNKLTYIGYYNYYQNDYGYVQNDKGKRHVFHDGSHFVIPSVGTLAECILEECVEDYAELVEKYMNSNHATKISDFEILYDDNKNKDFFYLRKNDQIICAHVSSYQKTYRLSDIQITISTFNPILNRRLIERDASYVNYSLYSQYYRNDIGRKNINDLIDYKKLIKNATKLNFEPQNMTRDQIIELMKYSGYGNIINLINAKGIKTENIYLC